MSESLLITRIALPAYRSHLVLRQRVLAQLRHLTDVPLTLVSAPAGFGKTTAVLEATGVLRQRADVTLTWLTLDERDNDPIHFWRYVTLAVHSTINNCGVALIEALAGPQPAPVRPLLIATINEIGAQDQHLVLVLDDYHFVDLPVIHDDLAFLLEHSPPNLHVAIITRADPPLPLHRWHARGQLLEVRMADLRFDPTRPHRNVIALMRDQGMLAISRDRQGRSHEQLTAHTHSIRDPRRARTRT